MRNTFLFLFLCCFAGSLSAQSFNRSIATADKAFVGEGTPVIAEGDINKDGIKDLVVAVPEVYQGKNFAFYFGQKQGGYALFRDYLTDVVGHEIKISVTDKGVVRIEYDIDLGADIFLFRYENGDFRLIGGKEDRHLTSFDYDVSYNYLTNKMIRTEGEGSSRKSETLDMRKLPKIHFGWIPLRYEMLNYLVEDDEDWERDDEDILALGRTRTATTSLRTTCSPWASSATCRRTKCSSGTSATGRIPTATCIRTGMRGKASGTPMTSI